MNENPDRPLVGKIDLISKFSLFLAKHWHFLIFVACASGLLHGTVYLLYFKIFPFEIFDLNDIVQLSIQNMLWLSIAIVPFVILSYDTQKAKFNLLGVFIIGLFVLFSMATGYIRAVSHDLTIQNNTAKSRYELQNIVLKLNAFSGFANTLENVRGDEVIDSPAAITTACNGPRSVVWTGDRAIVVLCVKDGAKYVAYKDYGMIVRRH